MSWDSALKHGLICFGPSFYSFPCLQSSWCLLCLYMVEQMDYMWSQTQQRRLKLSTQLETLDSQVQLASVSMLDFLIRIERSYVYKELLESCTLMESSQTILKINFLLKQIRLNLRKDMLSVERLTILKFQMQQDKKLNRALVISILNRLKLITRRTA